MKKFKKSISETAGFSKRLLRLHDEFSRRYADSVNRHGGKLYFEDDEWDAFCRSRLTAWRETVGQPSILRRARMLELFAADAIVRIELDDLIVGSQKFCAFKFPPETLAELQRLGYSHNIGHIIHDYGSLLNHGVDGLIGRIRRCLQTAASEDEKTTLISFEKAMRAFARFIVRHAEAAEALCATLEGGKADEWREKSSELWHIASKVPRGFSEALQLVWFAQIFLHAENPSAAISYGRLDQLLWSFLEKDLASGVLSLTGANDLVGAFFIRCCEGEESQNLAVGGVDAAGNDAANPLSIIMLTVMRGLRLFQPSLTVRMHEGSSSELVEAACELAAVGTGQPGFVNDRAAVPALMELGIPIGRARDYGIVGCYEAAPQGDSYPLTVACGAPDLPLILIKFMHSALAREAETFRVFLDGWLSEVEREYQTILAEKGQTAWNHWRDTAPSPFGSVLIEGCVERALPLEAGGAVHNLFGVNILGLGTAVDSLHAIEDLVFNRKEIPLEALSTAVELDFPDEALRRQLLSVPGRYGTDSEATNQLASEISNRIARIVLNSRLENGVRPYPGFFRFTADISNHPYATPDGRRVKDNLSYGCGPASAAGATPTSALASAAHVAHQLCACGNPLAISLQEQDTRDKNGIKRVKVLVLGYFAQGGFHVHFNIHSGKVLRAAKADPENYQDLTIRISGFSAKFVKLPENMQDALIERSEKGV
ncbi:MAG: hypothetical protein L6437_03065 [Kiritimatiellae bacterium]|nr:hypothetical protein [Verrucomicrobiota bacterium]MCG2659211.1 hypothetical protein [Kiritimatiellia bacterium]